MTAIIKHALNRLHPSNGARWIMIGPNGYGKTAIWIGSLFVCRHGIQFNGKVGFSFGFKGLRLKVWRNGTITRFYRS